MATRKYLGAISSALAAVLLASCGGGGGGTTPPVKTNPGTNGQSGTVKMTFSVPVRTSSSSVKRKTNYVSFSTKGFEISWETYKSATDGFNHTQACIANPTGGGCVSPVPSNFVGKLAPNLVSQNVTCGAQAGPGSSYSCTVIFPVPAGYNDFQLSLWDQTPFSYGTNNGFGGSYSATANMLSYNLSMDQQVLGAANNSFDLILHPVVHTMYLGLNPSSLVVGAAAPGTSLNPNAPTLQFFALDADGNTIHGTSVETYVDLNGNPVWIQVSPNQTNPGSPVGATAVMALNQPLSVTPNSCLALPANGGLNDPTQNACTVTYDGGDVLSVSYGGTAYTGCPGSCTSDAANVTVSGTTLGFTRSIDGPIIVPSEPVLNTVAIATNGTYYGTVARDGFTYTDDSNGNIQQVNTGGVVQAWNSGLGSLLGITQGPDNQIWFAAGPPSSAVDAFNLQSQTFMPALPTSGGVNDITTGSDDNMYFAEYWGNRVGEVQIIPGTQTTPPTYHMSESSPTLGTPYRIVTGSDGYAWFTDNTNNAIYSIAPGTPHSSTPGTIGTITKCNIPMTAPIGITPGADGYLYVAEAGANQRVDKIAVNSGVCFLVASYNVPTSSPFNLTTGADGNVYGTEMNKTTILRLSQAGQLTEFPYSPSPVFEAPFSSPDGKIWVTGPSATSSVYYFTP